MKLLAAMLLLLVPMSCRGGLVPAFYPAELEKADTILLVPSNQVKIWSSSGFDDNQICEIQSPVILKGSVGLSVRLSLTDDSCFVPPRATSYLVFLQGTGDEVKPVSVVGSIVGLTGNFDGVSQTLKQVKPDAWSLIAQCLIDEKDPACALHQSYILSDAPADVWQLIWEAVKGRKKDQPDLWLAYQNIGMRVIGVSALEGFIEPDFKNAPLYDSTGTRLFTVNLLGTMAAWFFRSSDQENYRNILDFVRGQRGQIGASALIGIMRSTQMSDLPELLDIFEHSPSMDIRYGCMHNFYYILGELQPSLIPGIDEFKKRPAKYTKLWKARVEEALGH